MPERPSVPGKLVNELGREQSFRRQVLSGVAELLKDPDTDPVLKTLVVLGLLVCVGISFVLSVLIIHALCYMLRGMAFDPFKYVYAIGAHLVVLMGLSVPIFVKAGPVEQAMRLEDSLMKINSARIK